jgi:cytochrome bd ubiquinol oxidase subunit II
MTLPLLIAGVIVIALNAYVLLGGADFGGGVWDLLASGPRREAQRERIAHALAPVWEANHVWLILVVVLLFTCFPAVFARLSIVLHVPLSLVLLGIVLRGAAFTFRAYGGYAGGERAWGVVFAVASLMTPLLLGVALGSIAAGRVVMPEGTGFVAGYIRPWLTPFAGSVGLLTLMLFAFLAAVYLTVETADDRALQEDFRSRALASGVGTFFAALLSLVLARQAAPLVWHGLMATPRAILIHLLTAASAVTALVALARRRYPLARVAAAAQVTFILWGWALAQYPALVPPDLGLDSAAPPVTLRLAAIVLALGGAVLLPSLRYLFRVFKSSAA